MRNAGQNFRVSDPGQCRKEHTWGDARCGRELQRLSKFAMAVVVGLLAFSSVAAAESCRTVHGRLELTNGTPSVRIWVVGTKRVLGVHQQDTTFDDLPSNIRSLWRSRGEVWGHRIFGDFRVCPLTPSHPGWMQMVHLESGKNLKLD